jgi:hypothetical protein
MGYTRVPEGIGTDVGNFVLGHEVHPPRDTLGPGRPTVVKNWSASATVLTMMGTRFVEGAETDKRRMSASNASGGEPGGDPHLDDDDGSAGHRRWKAIAPSSDACDGKCLELPGSNSHQTCDFTNDARSSQGVREMDVERL